MKVRNTVLISFLSAMVLALCPFSVSASYSLSPDDLQDVKDFISENAVASTNIQTYSVTDSDVSGGRYRNADSYQLDDAYTLYYMFFDSYELYQPEVGFTALLADEARNYVIPYEEQDEAGLLYLTRDNKGELRFFMGTSSQKGMFDITQVEAVAEQLDGVTEIRLVKEVTSAINLVYLATEDEEYIVPYAKEHVMGFYPDLQFGEIYKASDFMDWVTYGFDWERYEANLNKMVAGSAVPEYIGYEITPVDLSSDVNIPLTLGISGLGFAAAGSLAVYGTKTLKKKKAQNS